MFMITIHNKLINWAGDKRLRRVNAEKDEMNKIMDVSSHDLAVIWLV